MMANHLPPIVRHKITQATIDRYAELSGDFNPLHVDPATAARSAFGSTIAHGPIALQTFFVAMTSWLGSEILPAGTTFSARFLAPVRPGDIIECVIERTAGERPLATCSNQEGTIVIEVEIAISRGGSRVNESPARR